MPIPPNTLFYNQKIYHSLFVARTWQHFIDLLKRKNPRFTAFLNSNAYIKLAPNGSGPVRRLRPRPALRFIVKLTYLRRACVSVYRYSLEVFPVNRL